MKTVAVSVGRVSGTRLLFTSVIKLTAIIAAFEDLKIPRVWELECDTFKLNEWCRLTSAGVLRPFFFLEKNSDRYSVP
jgi:hypothetical protein